MSGDRAARSDRSPALLDALTSSVETTARLAGALSPGEIRQPAYPDEWTVAEVLSHLGSGAVIMLGRLDSTLGGKAEVESSIIWDEWNAKDPDRQVADALRADRRLLERLRSVDPDQRAAFLMQFGPLEVDFSYFLGLRLSEHAVHTWDVAVAFDPGATLLEAAVPSILDSLGPIAGFAGTGSEPRRTVRLHSHRPDRLVEVTVGPEGVTLEPADPASDDHAGAGAVLELPAEAVIRLVYGRLDPGHTPPYEGDPAVLEDLRGTFRGL